MTRAVVFAYHNVGVRCLSVLLAAGIDVSLVVTHEDDPSENIWFRSVANLASLYDIPTITPSDPHTPQIIARLRELNPDFLFSFYYRYMLKPEILNIPRHGALNMHGSLLPKYRGRVPINWAIIHGETETGATLHYMVEKPDKGDIVDQQAVPILPDDTAFDVFQKVTCAAELVLHRSLPALINGTAKRTPQNTNQASYFSGRRAEDGQINWHDKAIKIHNLVRAVAPPYPGAFTTLNGNTLRILKTMRVTKLASQRFSNPTLYCDNGRCFAQCGDGGLLRLAQLEWEGNIMNDGEFCNVCAGPTPLI